MVEASASISKVAHKLKIISYSFDIIYFQSIIHANLLTTPDQKSCSPGSYFTIDLIFYAAN